MSREPVRERSTLTYNALSEATSACVYELLGLSGERGRRYHEQLLEGACRAVWPKATEVSDIACADCRTRLPLKIVVRAGAEVLCRECFELRRDTEA